MKLTETIQEILLAVSIVITLPVMTYWGTQIFFPPNTDLLFATEEKQLTTQEQEVKLQQEQQYEVFKLVSFWTFLITAILAIVCGILIPVSVLSMGFIGGGLLNLIMTIVHTKNTPILNFSIFLGLFVVLILIIVTNKKPS